jgi:hypothetical protein
MAAQLEERPAIFVATLILIEMNLPSKPDPRWIVSLRSLVNSTLILLQWSGHHFQMV